MITRITKFIKHQNEYFCNYCQLRKNNLKPPWSILFFGTDKFSVASLKTICDEYKKGDLLSNLEVVTSLKNKRNSVEKFASMEKLVIHDWPIKPYNCDDFHLGVVVSFGHLIPKYIINSFPLGMLNVHASLLPRWRGAAPIIHAIANGDEKTGVTVMKLKPHKFDIGEIIKQDSVEIPHHVNMPDLYDILANLGAQALVKTIEDLPLILNHAIPQPESGVTLAPRVTSKMACINWTTMSARDVYNLGRALAGLFHLSTKFNDISVKLYDIAECSSQNNTITINNDRIMPGCVMYRKESKMLHIQCADGKWVCVEKVVVSGKKMAATDFNNGFLNKQIQHLRIFR